MKLEQVYQQWNKQTSYIQENIIPFEEILEIARTRWNLFQACQLDPITWLSHDYMNKVSFVIRYIEMILLWIIEIDKLREILWKMEKTNYRKNYKLYWIRFDEIMNQKIKSLNNIYKKIRTYRWPILWLLFLINRFLQILWISTDNTEKMIKEISWNHKFSSLTI